MKKYKLPFKFRNSILIKSIDDYNLVCEDILNDLVESLCTDERYSTINEDEEIILLNNDAFCIIERTKKRLIKLGIRIFYHTNGLNVQKSSLIIL